MDNKTGLFYEINGDVFLNHKATLAFNPITKTIVPARSPIYDTMRGAILSLKTPVSFKMGNILSIFDVHIYYSLFVTVLAVVVLLHFSKKSGKLVQKSFHQKFVEFTLLLAFNRRMFGLVRERSHVVRLVLLALILPGLVMRKAFKGQLKAIRAFESFDYVSELDSTFSSQKEIEKIITHDFLGLCVLNVFMPTLENKYDVVSYDNETTEMDELLNTESIYFYTREFLERIQSRYSFIPTKISELSGSFGQMAVYYFSIYTNSSLFDKLYKRLHFAYDVGITQFAFRDKERMESHYFRISNQTKQVFEIYQNSYYFINKWQNCPLNLLRFGFYVLIIGFGRALISFLYECRSELQIKRCF